MRHRSSNPCSPAPPSMTWDARHGPVRWRPTGSFGDRPRHCGRLVCGLCLTHRTEDLAWRRRRRRRMWSPLLPDVVCCLMSQQHASVSQCQICSDKCICCHTEMKEHIKLSISLSHSIQTPGQPVPELTYNFGSVFVSAITGDCSYMDDISLSPSFPLSLPLTHTHTHKHTQRTLTTLEVGLPAPWPDSVSTRISRTFFCKQHIYTALSCFHC